MGCVRTDQARLSGGRLRQNVAADIARRQANAAQAADHQLGKILANALAAFQDLFERRGNVGRRAVKLEIIENPLRQLECRLQLRPSPGVTEARIVFEVAAAQDMRRLVQITAGLKQRGIGALM